MEIWKYDERSSTDIVESYGIYEPTRCVYCKTNLTHLLGNELQGGYLGADLGGSYGDQGKRLQVCQHCGWWILTKKDGYSFGSYEGSLSIRRSCGSLKNLDLSNIEMPIEEFRQYLLARYESRFQVNPKKYEEIVAGVFSDYGYRVRVTSYSGDDGIDVFVFDGDKGDTIGIQVKRYKGKIEAEQLRAFGGALVLGGLTKGIFVTTSSFRSGAVKTTKRYEGRDLAISLWDADKFYSELQLTQRDAYTNPNDPSAPYYDIWSNTDMIPVVYSHSW